MKLGKVEVTRQQLIIGAVAIAAVAAFVIYMALYAPLLSKLRIKYGQCNKYEKQIADGRELINVAGKTYSDRVLMTEKDVSSAIDEFAKHGKEQGINFISMKPGEAAAGSSSLYKVMPLEMEVEAKDEAFAKFLGSLDELKRVVITVRSFDVVPVQDDRSRVKARLIVDMYISGRD